MIAGLLVDELRMDSVRCGSRPQTLTPRRPEPCQALIARRALLSYVGALLVMSVLDALWLGWLAKDFYQRELGSLMRAQIWLTPALLFYLLYPISLHTTSSILRKSMI